MPGKEDLPNSSRDNFSGDRSEVQPVEIKRFSKEAREALERQGFSIYELTGKSIKTHREAGRLKGSTWGKNRNFEVLESRRSEVAVNPNAFFLPESNYKTLWEQEELVK